jgi:hypothetical protein
MDLAVCRHNKTGGGRCGSPAMRGQDYCYFHAGSHRAIPTVNLWPKPKAHSRLGEYRANAGKDQDGPSDATHHDVPWPRCKLTGDALAIQIGLSHVVQGITQGLLNVRQAKIFLAALHRAAANLRMNWASHQFRISHSPCNIQSLNDYNKRTLPLSIFPSAMAQGIGDKNDHA